jgi:subtilisin-like proprotein convertase family protein/V8-like Glu-specific endopeptidase
MTNLSKLWVVCCLFLLSCGDGTRSQSPHGNSDEKVIYGENGLEPVTPLKTSPWLEPFQSVALITEKSRLQKQLGFYSIQEKEPASAPICEGEPLEKAKNLGHCTGSLIEEDLLVTARHCLDLVQGGCEDLAVLFDVKTNLVPGSSKLVASQNVFSCKRVYKPEDETSDMVMIRLDRTTSRPSLEFKAAPDWLSIGELTVLGYPLGGVQTISKGGSFRESLGSDLVLAELDVFEGNSGSPVFSDDKKVRGILVSGESDFEADTSGCLKVKRCKTGYCSGETLLSSSTLTDFFNKVENLEAILKRPFSVVFEGLLLKNQKIPEPSTGNPAPTLEASFSVDSSKIVSEVSLNLEIVHPNLSDITLDLITPSGKVIRLYNRTYLKADNGMTFEFRSQDDTRFDSLIGTETSGLWKVMIKDESELESGKVVSLSLKMLGTK